MKELMCSLKWRKLILVSMLIGGLLGVFDSGLAASTVYGNLPGGPGDGCPENTFCKTNGCSSGSGGMHCSYDDPYHWGCPTHITCPNTGE